jgi:hypothetical protein
MILESFLLLKEAPVAHADVRDVALGEISDGIWLADSFPADLRFGVLLEFSIRPDEDTEQEVMLLLSEARPQPGRFIPLDSISIPIAPASEGYWAPRFDYRPFEVELEIVDEQDMLLWVAVGQTLVALKPLLVRPTGQPPPPVEWG